MINTQVFSPNWTSSPGDTIRDILRERNISNHQFAQKIGKTYEETNDLLLGRSTINLALARELERVLGASIEFWMSRDFQYRQDVVRFQNLDEQNWINSLPIGDMIKFGWLNPIPLPAEEKDVCLRFFGVDTVDAWRTKYSNIQKLVAFKRSTSFDSRFESVAAWLRQGEIKSEEISCEPWNPERFRQSLSEIRSLTRQKDPNRFLPKLHDICAASGVAVVIVRAPNGCRASGATQFVKYNKAMILLSFRHLTDDHFWFTFFHEAGHLLLHSDHSIFVDESINSLNVFEQQANEFAQNVLIPSQDQSKLEKIKPISKEIIRFAIRIGVSPGIVVGQLQHRKVIGYNQLNDLKRRFVWHT